MKRNWIYKFSRNGFQMVIIIEGTEDEMREYLPEINPNGHGWYSGATDDEVAHYKALGMPIYLAPSLPSYDKYHFC